MSKPSAAPRPTNTILATLVGAGIANSALAIYQWVELLTVRAGGRPTCAINETVNCAAVWDSAFASRLHELFGMPVAGLGLVWGVTATVLAGFVFLRTVKGGATEAPTAAAKLWSIAGALAVVTFATASLRGGAICPTCAATYVLTLAYAGLALFKLPGGVWPASNSLVPGIGWSAAVGAASFLVLLYPGSNTPKAGALVLAGGHDTNQVLAYMNNLPQRDAMQTSMARAEYLRSPEPDVSNFVTRVRLGPVDAPVRLVDFTEVRCGHCRTFEEAARELYAVVPKGRLSLEPRYFPLDGQCNREVQRKGTDNVSCLGAKVQICLEQHPKFWDVRRDLFTNQAALTDAKVLEIALTSGVSRDDLMRCVESYETQAKIDADVAYALLYGIDGTPLVLLNGRKTQPVPPFILGMALANGDVNAPYFQNLPPAPPAPVHEH